MMSRNLTHQAQDERGAWGLQNDLAIIDAKINVGANHNFNAKCELKSIF